VKFSYRRSPTDEQAIEVDIVALPEREGVYHVTVGDHVFELAERLVHQVAFCKNAGEITLQLAGREYHLFDASQRRRPTPTGAGDLCAPMAGKIIRVLVRPGEQVKAGATLLRAI
jgi:acetyl/propionyl-CoA carboxylase alpha subunit